MNRKEYMLTVSSPERAVTAFYTSFEDVMFAAQSYVGDEISELMGADDDVAVAHEGEVTVTVRALP